MKFSTLNDSLAYWPGIGVGWISGHVPGVESKWDISETAFNLKLKFKKPDNG